MDNEEGTSIKRMAPVLVSVYDRRNHLEACIEALKENTEAKDTVLYIVSDGWQHEGHRESIEEVRAYIKTISGFKEVKFLFRDTNWGMKRSGIDSINWVFEEHDCVIRMEDDIVCSPYYLKYMNEALDLYKADKRMFCICAHTHPKFKKPSWYAAETFLWQSFASWGFAIWKDRWLQFVSQIDLELQEIRDDNKWKAYQKIRPVMNSQQAYLDGKIHNDSKFALHMFLNNKYALFPTRSMTINSGFDGSGSHCGLGWTYSKQLLTQAPIQHSKEIILSDQIQNIMRRANYSVLNNGIGGVLRRFGIFDPLYGALRKIFCLNMKRSK
jgi:hypothetical protein